MGAMSRENVELYERTFVEKHLDAVARGRLARGPTFVGSLGLRVQGLVAALAVLVDLLLGHGCRRSLRSFDSFEAWRRAANWRK